MVDASYCTGTAVCTLGGRLAAGWQSPFGSGYAVAQHADSEPPSMATVAAATGSESDGEQCSASCVRRAGGLIRGRCVYHVCGRAVRCVCVFVRRRGLDDACVACGCCARCTCACSCFVRDAWTRLRQEASRDVCGVNRAGVVQGWGGTGVGGGGSARHGSEWCDDSLSHRAHNRRVQRRRQRRGAPEDRRMRLRRSVEAL